ncbi:elongation factor Ts [Atopostipes suicloacalis DSM 15692]|uniref:Elongation factor Ts n=1 Tax=Atopostipes suicloacalis DSM 15692 TaxID=1121025 RepID=A0A1M4TFZ7_9LACT|nr:translation elongation factor Ts [Atopostipes suicloacalis]SHE43366.1 elongation factor Ts [Atopostipes suicloacalis DSM 15692]
MAKIKAAQVKELRDRTGVGMMDAKKALVSADGDMDQAIDILREKGVATAAKKADRISAEGLSYIHVEGNTAAVVEVNSETDYVAKNEQFQTLVKDIAKAIAINKPASVDEAKDLKMDDGETISDNITSAITTIGENITLRRFELIEKEDNEVFGAYEHMGGSISVLTLIEGGSEEVARNVAMHIAALNPQYLKREDVPQETRDHELNILSEQAKNEGKPEHIVEKMVEGRLNKWLAEISLVDQPYVKDGDKTVQEYLNDHNASIKSFTRLEVGEGIEKREEDFAEEVRNQMNL